MGDSQNTSIVEHESTEKKVYRSSPNECNVSDPSEWKWSYDEKYSVWDLTEGSGLRIAHIEKRPSYCDRGHWIARIEIPCDLDRADSWPNYYMSINKAKEEVFDFLQWRLFKVTNYQEFENET